MTMFGPHWPTPPGGGSWTSSPTGSTWGLNVPGAPGAGRLVVTTGMCTHKVGLRSTDEVDDELVEWLRQAYNRAG